MRIKFYIFIWLASAVGFATTDQVDAQKLRKLYLGPPDQYSGLSQMNDIAYERYQGFAASWRLVTARYRSDSHEMRFAYANEIAWKAISGGSSEYPDGSVFAKIGFLTEEDPLFTSSEVPAGTKRYQFMVRDKKKYAETSGWGYALFNAKGVTFPGEPRSSALACAACHSVARERGFVFSQPLKESPFSSSLAAPETENPSTQKSINMDILRFISVERKSLPPIVRDFVPSSETRVNKVSGSIEHHLFEGTLQEIQPTLIRKVETAKIPAVLFSQDGKFFSIAYSGTDSSSCGQRLPYKTVMSVAVPVRSKRKDAFQESFVKVSSVCK